MIYRHPKRWCDECKQVVFAREHAHRRESSVTIAAEIAACGGGDCPMPRAHAHPFTTEGDKTGIPYERPQ